MKPASIIILFLAIFAFYSIPTMYEGFIEHKLNRVSHSITRDLLDARRQAIKTRTTSALIFNVEDNSYTVMNNEKEVKKVFLNNISSSVTFYGGIFNDGISLTDNRIVFNQNGVCNVYSDKDAPANADSIFLIHKRDWAKNILERIVRIYINKENCGIAQLRVKTITEQGELVFGN